MAPLTHHSSLQTTIYPLSSDSPGPDLRLFSWVAARGTDGRQLCRQRLLHKPDTRTGRQASSEGKADTPERRQCFIHLQVSHAFPLRRVEVGQHVRGQAVRVEGMPAPPEATTVQEGQPEGVISPAAD